MSLLNSFLEHMREPIKRSTCVWICLFVHLVLWTLAIAAFHLWTLAHPQFLPNARTLFEAMRDKTP